MESLWNSLYAKAENISLPAWHEDLLKQRHDAFNEGIEAFVDWDEAKKDILSQLR